MRLSRYFLPVLKETPAEAQIVSHRYMLRAGMIKQASAGIYSWLPLGYKVLRKIEQIVREAIAPLEAEKAQLSEILSEIPIAVMAIDRGHRVTLYDR